MRARGAGRPGDRRAVRIVNQQTGCGLAQWNRNALNLEKNIYM